MFEEVMFGPVCIITRLEDEISCKINMFNHGHIMIMEIKKGEFFDEIKNNFSLQNSTIVPTSLLLSVAYKKIYES